MHVAAEHASADQRNLDCLIHHNVSFVPRQYMPNVSREPKRRNARLWPLAFSL
jgi:hypothetical protein